MQPRAALWMASGCACSTNAVPPKLPVKVTDRIAPGVVSINEGAWFAPDHTNVDTQGCANVLADDRAAPCGATTYNSNWVQVEAVR